MNTAELKKDLYKIIAETDDINILSKIQVYLKTLTVKNVDWWDIISDKEKELIETGLKQLDNGGTLSHSEVREEVKKLLRKDE
ncbi:MAG: hypothetical protein K8S00_05930 [Bacteroidales bacterium]|nr:hypothetical protein [Bacteroidales bacterium]